ncbi:MAG: ParB/RepB/Spo0J family partition protein [Alistipes sp.]|nr:ParB/RepB/Spo0J family partition protein [Alistipes sp.]
MKQEKGLGRGLSALFGDSVADLKAKPMAEMVEIKVTDIIPNPTQPRRDFDEEALAELADSIRTLGLIQPITVKREGEKYLLISGERRWRASQAAGIESLPAYIRDVDDENLHAMALVENIQREDLNAIEIALGLKRLIEECGLTQDALAEKVGKKRSTVANYLRLLNLPNEVQLALKEGVISAGHAKAIAALAEHKQQLAALKKCIKSNLSVRQAEDYVRAILNAEGRPKVAIVEEEYPESYTRLVEHLERFFSQNISIKRGRNGGGKITIDFDNDNDIERFIERFSKR